MKGESKELKITKITWEKFKQLNLYGYRHVRKYFRRIDDTVVTDLKEVFETVKDSNGDPHVVGKSGYYSKLIWERVDLNDIVSGEIEFSKEEGWKNPICLAIHEEVTELEFQQTKENFVGIKNDEDIMSYCLFSKSYLDKYLTRSGNQTYLIRCDVKHLYSKRNYFYTKDDYFEIQKDRTKAVYLIDFE